MSKGTFAYFNFYFLRLVMTDPVVKTAHTEMKLRRLVMLLLTKHLYDCRIKTFDNWVLKISKWIWI